MFAFPFDRVVFVFQHSSVGVVDMCNVGFDVTVMWGVFRFNVADSTQVCVKHVVSVVLVKHVQLVP